MKGAVLGYTAECTEWRGVIFIMCSTVYIKATKPRAPWVLYELPQSRETKSPSTPLLPVPWALYGLLPNHKNKSPSTPQHPVTWNAV